MKLALIGAGQRGMIYSDYAGFEKGIEIVAVADPDKKKREIAAEKFSIKKERQYKDAEEFFREEKLCDAVIISTLDKDHFSQAMKALEAGYDILLEKPISPDPRECLRISEEAGRRGRRITVCHVLRYTDFFSTIKRVLDTGELGRIVAIQHNENVGNFHIAHSFVRGNWRRSDTTSPIIMAKSCHDMDILAWLAGSEAKKIASFGSLAHFKEENAPAGSAARCLDCGIAEQCHYNAVRAYLPVRGFWPASVLTPDQSEEGIMEALRTGPYGRCVYRCDNTVCDHQVTIIEFKNGIHASFTLSGFTDRVCRTMKIMCEQGEIRAEDNGNQIEITRFSSNAVDPVEKKVIRTAIPSAGHGGGDASLMEDFIGNFENSAAQSRTAIKNSIESHIMAYAAEQSRVSGQTVDVDELKAKLMEECGD